MIAFSGSPESASAMRKFVQSALWPDLQIQIVSFGPEQAKCECLLEGARRYCAAHGLQVSTRFVQGAAPKLILNEIESFDADVVVLGSSHRNIFMRKIFGETARAVIQNSRLNFLRTKVRDGVTPANLCQKSNL